MLVDGRPRPVPGGLWSQTVWADQAENPEETARLITWPTEPVACCQNKIQAAFEWIAPVYYNGTDWAPLPQPCPKCGQRIIPQGVQVSAADPAAEPVR